MLAAKESCCGLNRPRLLSKAEVQACVATIMKYSENIMYVEFVFLPRVLLRVSRTVCGGRRVLPAAVQQTQLPPSE